MSSDVLKQLLVNLVQSPLHHARWLNTLSYLENSGARAIAACEHPTLVKKEMLKHAAEEFRHAHYLKQQIERVTPIPLVDYTLPNLLGGLASLHYLKSLNVQTCRYLIQDRKVPPDDVSPTAYLLVTYAIECRAEELYTCYETILRATDSKVMVKSIFLEELEHLEEMRAGIRHMPDGEVQAEKVCTIETRLWESWLQRLSMEWLSS